MVAPRPSAGLRWCEVECAILMTMWSPLTRRDKVHLGLLTALYGVLVILLSPARDYPVIDDWMYAQVVRHMQVVGTYLAHPIVVTSFVAQAWWGRVFADLFGYSYTTLTWSTLVLSWAGILCFYGLLRRLSLPPGPALFGALVLLFNPIYLHLSYSFMSDVPFIALVLAAALALVRSFQDNDDRWLLIGMLLASLAVLVRQLGVLIPLAALIYLWAGRRLTRPRAGALVLPVMTLGIFLAWQAEHSNSATAVNHYVSPLLKPAADLSDLLLASGGQSVQLLLRTCLLGLWLLPLAPQLPRFRPRRSWAVAGGVLGLLMLASYLRMDGLGGFPLNHTGSVLDAAGFLILTGTPGAAPPLLTPGIWLGITLVGFALTVWLVVVAGVWLQDHRPNLRLRVAAAPWGFLGLLALALLGGPAWTPYPYDRYFLPALPLLLIPLLLRLSQASRRAWLTASVLLATVALFSLLAQADFADWAEAHWRAGNQLLAQGVDRDDIDAGFEWRGMHVFNAIGVLLPYRPAPTDAAGRRLPAAYEVEETPLAGYHIIGQVPYYSRLGGFTWRASYLLARDGVVGGTR